MASIEQPQPTLSEATRKTGLLSLFILLMAILSGLAVGLPGQCQRGRHPVGVGSVAGTGPGCQEIDGTGIRTWFSMFVAPSERGGFLTFSYLDPPSAGFRPAFAFGYTVISTAVSGPGVQVPGMGPGCLFHVPFDVLLPARVPLLPGCQTQAWVLPPFPGLAGFQFFAQTWVTDLTVARDMVTNVIQVTVQL
jgi:hypothetical protein